jgi:DNA-binding protein HU-beta
MNRKKLIEILSEETAFSKRDITKVLDSFLRVLMRILKKNGKVQWSGFGTFSVAKRAARKGINPATKESINLPEIFVPKFKAGKLLKETIRSLGERKKTTKDSNATI